MNRVRVRQHVNPLSRKYQESLIIPGWEKVYIDINKPLHLDIGCGRGRFLLSMAQEQPEWNYLGLEIREALVEEANDCRDKMGLNNLHYLFGNANNCLSEILASFPHNVLQRVTIQFPDPWFKKRHQKRRVVQEKLLDDLAKYLVIGGEVLLQSDVENVAIDMRDRFDHHPDFQQQGDNIWLSENPLPVPTERELATFAKGKPVYRALFMKVSL